MCVRVGVFGPGCPSRSPVLSWVAVEGGVSWGVDEELGGNDDT
jgi:hypothetical protein